MVLFINACVRKDSRTKDLADYLLLKKKMNPTGLDIVGADVDAILKSV